MPLLDKKPHKLLQPPGDLEQHESVFQIHLTKEIVRDYKLYLEKLDLYEKPIWTCGVTGKTGLTYKEALESEKGTEKKTHTLPQELMVPALQIIQFSTLSLRDLAEVIVSELHDYFYTGAEVFGKKDQELSLCKISKIIEDQDGKPHYEVCFNDKDTEMEERTAVLCKEDLSWKKFPFSRNFVKNFIRESTYRSIPWVLKDNLSQLHGISTEIPKELKGKYVFHDGLLIHTRKRQEAKGDRSKKGKCKQIADETAMEYEEGPIVYPIEDQMVQIGPEDSEMAELPSPSRDFIVPMDCVGDLLMIWDFCCCFARQLNLWRFTLEDFENAICYKESNLTLLVEIHVCLFQFFINDGAHHFSSSIRKSHKSKITLMSWNEYLCDMLESIDIPDISSHIGTIKQGDYYHLDADVKLKMLREFVDRITETDLFRDVINELMEQCHALGAARREEALEEGRKRREKKEQSKNGEEASNGILDKDSEESKTTRKKKYKKKKKKNTSNMIESCSKGNITAEKRISEGSEKEDQSGNSERRTAEQRRKYYEREMEKIVIKTEPLGRDRNYNRYWWFRHNGRIFIESPDSKEWAYYSSKEEIDALMRSLNCKGIRELSLHQQLEKFYDRICLAVEKRAKEMAQSIEMEEGVLRRSTRVRAPSREIPAKAFLRYVNKWRQD